MIIKELRIKSFGPLIDRVITPSEGLNIFRGENESGKSTVAMFIKFILYGLSAKAAGDDTVSEKAHYVNWDTGIASGSMTFEAKDSLYRIDRMITLASDLDGRENYRESVKLTDLATGETVKTPKSPGEYFFGFPEKVFMQSAFVRNLDKTKVDGSGLKVALENLASSGDEEINTKKALERIDGARKLLKHKNGLGGMISDLTDEKRALTDALVKSQDISKEVVDVEGTLADVSVKIKRREEEEVELSALCRAYEAVRTGTRVKEIENLEGTVRYLEGELASLDPAVDRQLLAKIDLCEGTVSDTERDIAALTEKREELEAKCEGRDLTEPEDGEEVMRKAKKMKDSYTFKLTFGITSLVLAVAAAAFLALYGVTMLASNKLAFVLTVIGFFVFLALGVTGIVLYKKDAAKYAEYVARYEAEDIYTLENAVLIKREKFRYTKKLIDKMETIDAVLNEAIAKHDREIDRGMSYGAMFGADFDNVFDALAAAKAGAEDICVRRETMSSKLESVKGRLSALLEEVSDSERENAEEAEAEALQTLDRDRILEMTKEEYLEAVRQRDFADSQLKALKVREADLEKKLAALRAGSGSPAETAGRISCIDEQIASLTFKHNALMLAYKALERAGEKMRGDIMPQVTEKAAAIMNRVTEGRYPTLSSGEALDLSVSVNDEKRSIDFLSEGTKDAAYISLRAALVETMYGEETPTMIFDDCFARLDGTRLSGLLSIMSKEEFPQSFVFTCRPLEAEASPGANIILM